MLKELTENKDRKRHEQARLRMILSAAESRPLQWLNCSGVYIGEALALQCRGLITTRIDNGQLRVRLKQSYEEDINSL